MWDGCFGENSTKDWYDSLTSPEEVPWLGKSSAKWPVFFSQGSFAYYFARVRANLGWGGIRCSGVRN